MYENPYYPFGSESIDDIDDDGFPMEFRKTETERLTEKVIEKLKK